MDKVKDYFEQLLENVADEINIKEVVLQVADQKSVYSFDTVWGRNSGVDDNYALYSLLFTGKIVEDMKRVREMVNDGLRQRAEAKIKVRQPLQSITICLKSQK